MQKKRTKPEKPTSSQKTLGVSAEKANLKEFLKDSDDVLSYLEAILADIFDNLTHYRQADWNRDLATLRRRFHHEGLSFATQTLPDLFIQFLNYLEGGTPSYPSFKLTKDGKHPVFLRQLFAKVCECLDNGESCTSTMQALYQLCHAFKKYRGPYKHCTLQKQLWSFVEDDISLRYIDYFSDPLYPLVVVARAYVKDIIGDLSPEFDAEHFVPVPGPGAVNTPRRKNVRYRPHVLYKQLDDVFPYEDWFYSHPWDIVTDPKGFKSLERIDAPSSRFTFVPKTYAKPRGICIEELETQYLQQSIKRALYHRLETHPLTKGRVNFTSQDINRKLALTASQTREFATLDMSAASDRVSRTLVRYLFHDCPDMVDALMATSTRTITLPDGYIDFPADFPCQKFAPMGSATCFPVMALVHFVIIKAILALSKLPLHLIRDVYVYGDDIIVRSECVDLIYETLPKFGMKFNTDKSYVNSYFRESCGMHAYKGEEITPEYMKYIPLSHSPRNVVLSLLSTEARLFQKGFRRTAALIRLKLSKVSCVRGYDFPFVRPKSPVLGWIREDRDAPFCRHIGLKRRFNFSTPLDASIDIPDTHTNGYWEVYALVAKSSQDDLTIDKQHEAYLRKLCDWGANSVSAEKRIEDSATKHRPDSRCTVKYSTRISRFTLSHRLALADHAKTSAEANVVKDSPVDPPRIIREWVPESAM
jgi:hypothetical protein